MVTRVMAKVGYSRSPKEPCPVSVCLVGNKYDLTARGKHSVSTTRYSL